MKVNICSKSLLKILLIKRVNLPLFEKKELVGSCECDTRANKIILIRNIFHLITNRKSFDNIRVAYN